MGQELTEIHYKADPANLLDTIEIDLSKLDRDTKNMYVKDLELTGKKDVELTTPEDALIFYITDHLKAMDEAVSYTHLDVYKRQLLVMTVFFLLLSFSFCILHRPDSSLLVQERILWLFFPFCLLLKYLDTQLDDVPFWKKHP